VLLALLALLACAGCDKLLGLSTTVAADAPTPPDAGPPVVHLTYQLLADPAAAPTYPAITDQSVVVQIAAIGDANLVAPDMFDSTTGAITLPVGFDAQPYRLVYTIGGGVPHEMQWQAHDGAHLVAPVWGTQPPRMAPPANATVEVRTIIPQSFGQASSSGVNDPAVVATGTWTALQSPTTNACVSGTGMAACGSLAASPCWICADDFPFDAAHLTSGSGTLGNPQPASGDQQTLIAFDAPRTSPGYSSVGYATIGVSLAPNTLSPALGGWKRSTLSYTPRSEDIVALNNEISAVFSTMLQMKSSMPSFIDQGGFAPSVMMPAFEELAVDGSLDATPVFVPLAQAVANNMTRTFADPFTPALPIMAAAQYTTVRPAGNANLTSGFQEIQQTQQGGAPSFVFPVEAPTNVRFAGKSLYMNDDDQGGNAVTLTRGSFADLKFDVASGARVDVCLATLFQLVPSGLLARYRFVVPNPGPNPATTSVSISVDTQLFNSGSVYVFQIVCRDGYPNAAQGDFSVVSYPTSESQIFPATFQVILQ
jgi:hypothetical protein